MSLSALRRRYEYEVFSGTATEASSESLVSNQGWVGALARRVGLLRAPAAGAVHTLMVQTPTGLQRTFRCGRWGLHGSASCRLGWRARGAGAQSCAVAEADSACGAARCSLEWCWSSELHIVDWRHHLCMLPPSVEQVQHRHR